MGAPTNTEIRKALLRLARAWRSYSHAFNVQLAAGNLYGSDGILTGEAHAESSKIGKAGDEIKEIAERLLKADIALRRVASGKAFEYSATILGRDTVITFDVDPGAGGDELTPASVEGDGEDLTEACAAECLAAVRADSQLIDEARLAWAEEQAQKAEDAKEAAAELRGDEQREAGL